jgi:hypothetical protein
MCTYCDSELDRRVIENEQHFLLACPLYVDIRRANNLQPSNISDHTFVFLSSTDPSKLWKLGKIVFEAFSHRKHYLILCLVYRYVMYVPYLLYSSMYCGALYMYYVYLFIGALSLWPLLPE